MHPCDPGRPREQRRRRGCILSSAGIRAAVRLPRVDQAKADPSYTGFKRDDAQLHVSSFAGVSGLAVYIWVDDLEALHEEFAAKGIAIIGPFDQTWGTRELAVRDGDGNTFCFGQRRN